MNPRSAGPSSEPFQPFQPGSPPAGPASKTAPVSARAKLSVASRGEEAPAFTPMETVRGTAAHAHSGQPTISLERNGDRVTSIRIECACGQVIELDCRYGPD